MPSLVKIVAAGRASPLSQVQIKEVASHLAQIYPHVEIEPLLFETKGDKDQATSLRLLGKCNFFTGEIDQAVLDGRARIAIHSAKDLPEPLEEGITVVALTAGVDSFDSLVLREGEALAPGMRIATSSVRREEAASAVCPDLSFVDIRGAIGQRLAKLEEGAVDGVVVAEAALTRLGLHHLNRIRLPGETTPYQGQLAILAREGDEEMRQLFAPLDVRAGHRILYLGLDPSAHILRGEVTHCPLIEIVPLRPEIPRGRYSHILFTSKTAVDLFDQPIEWPAIAVGERTAERLRRKGIQPVRVAEDESSEGVVEILDGVEHLLWPHSRLSRRVIPNYCEKTGIELTEVELYTTQRRAISPPDLEQFDEIAFTSPSTVNAFFHYFDQIPPEVEVWTQGAVTRLALLEQTQHANTGVQHDAKSSAQKV